MLCFRTRFVFALSAMALAIALLPATAQAARVASGTLHTCAITKARTVVCWGQGTKAQLGDGVRTDADPVAMKPVLVAGIDNVVDIAAGDFHTCALRADGRVWCWGDNRSAQSGVVPFETDGFVHRPTRVRGLDRVVALGAATRHTCALLQDHTVRCWGVNTDGQLGEPAVGMYSIAPVAVKDLTDAVSIAAGSRHNCAVTTSGGLKCWGNNAQGQLGDGTDGNIRTTPTVVTGLTGVTHVAVDGYINDEGMVSVNHTCASVAAGNIYCWGDNQLGQLGIGSVGGRRVRPTLVPGLNAASSVVIGSAHSCAVMNDRSVRCWGNNENGQIGNGTTMGTSLVPTQVGGAVNVVDIDGHSGHTCAIDAAGIYKCWGSNEYSELGRPGGGPYTAAPVLPFPLAVGVAVGGSHACALRSGGTVECWGGNDFGQLGSGAAGVPRATPSAVSATGNVAALAAAAKSTCALLDSGAVHCWGDNGSGVLGQGAIGGFQAVPSAAVVGLSDAVTLGAGSRHVCAVRGGGAISCWGNNDYGQLGDGTRGTARSGAVAVSGVTDAVAVASGETHSCALLSTSTVKCWGNNTRGQLGTGVTGSGSNVPVAVPGTDFVAIAAGAEHTCAVRSDEKVLCWGASDDGETGSVRYAQPVPTIVAGSDGALLLAAGSDHNCTTGNMYCWGLNLYGQLGDAGRTSRASPAAVVGADGQPLPGVRLIAAGGAGSCAVQLDGKVWCWGRNQQKQVGNTKAPAEQLVAVAVDGYDDNLFADGFE